MTMLWSCPNPGCPPTQSAPRDVEDLDESADEPRNFLSPQELAEYAGVSLTTVYGWNKQASGPPYYRVGKHIQYRLSDVQQWSSERRAQLAAVCSSECGRTYRRDDRNYLVLAKPNVIMNDIRFRGLGVAGSDAAGRKPMCATICRPS